MTGTERVMAWVAERLPLEDLSYRTLVEKKDVPVHSWNWAYYLGGAAAFLFVIQLITGLMLLFYYEPTVSDAHASIEHITRHVAGGALVRNLHTWSASAMIFVVLVHAITAFAMKAFAPPRELVWLTGVLLLGLTFGFGFTGYLLPWHQIAVNATKVGLQSIEEIDAYLPGALAEIPSRVRVLIQGGASVSQSTLSRFYAVHVVVLPLVFIGTLGLHLLSVQLLGISRGTDRPAKRTERFFPFFVIKDFALWGIAFLVLFTFSMTIPFESFFSYPLFEAYDAMGSTPDGIKPEWYFYFVFYPLELLPFWLVTLMLMGASLVLILTPWIFRTTSRRTLRILAGAVTVYLVTITVFGQSIYEFFRGGSP